MHGENGKGSLLRSKEEKLRVIGMQCINWEEIRSVTNKDLYRSPGQKKLQSQGRLGLGETGDSRRERELKCFRVSSMAMIIKTVAVYE